MPSSNQRHRAAPQKKLVEFVVGEVHYAVDIDYVETIVNPHTVMALPHTPPEVAGVADYRGIVVPIIDLRTRFGLPAEEPTRATKWILIKTSPMIGIIVDAVIGVFGTDGEELRPTPEVGGRKDVRGIMGVAMHENKTRAFVLDTHRFVEIVQHIDMDSLATPGAT